MAVVALRAVHEPHPVLMTVFCVQTYWRDRDRMAKARFEQYVSMEAALRAGKAAARRAPGVHVYRVRGNVEADYWEPPVVLATYGETPAVAA